MAMPTRGRHRWYPSTTSFCFSLVLLSQLAWILPCTYYWSIATPRDDAIDAITYQGYIEPLLLLSEQNLTLINEIPKKWQNFFPALEKKTVAKGFKSFPGTCFIWLPECFTIAKHSKILQIVEEAIGPNALLYSMTVWQGKNEAMQRFHRDGTAKGCLKKINFVTGAGVQLVTRSHKMSELLGQMLLKGLIVLQKDSMKLTNKEDQVAFLEKEFSRIIKGVTTSEMLLKFMELEPGYGVFFHGGSIYGIEETVGNNTAMLLQFVSGYCEVRESGGHDWGSQGISGNLYMPPVLLGRGDVADLGVSNDVRMRLADEDAIALKADTTAGTYWFRGNSSEMEGRKDSAAEWIKNITFLSGSSSASTSTNLGIWKFQKIVEASTAIIEHSIIDYFELGKKMTRLDFGMVNGDAEHEHVLVVIEEGLIYIRAINEQDFCYWELLELKPGSAVVLSKTVPQALVPLGPEAAFVLFRWVCHSSLNTKPFEFENVPEKETENNNRICTSQGLTLTLSGGQGYDMIGQENCDALIFMVDGLLLQVLPFNSVMLPFDILLIPSSQSCVLWNSGRTLVKLFIMHICHYGNTTQIMSSYGIPGKVI